MRLLLLTLIICVLALPARAQYSGGSGTAEDPYQIATAADLILLGETPDDYDKQFILTADIDLDPNLPGGKVFDRAVIAPDTSDVANGFQGKLFCGTFDGDGRTISNLTIVGESYLGLFGRSGEMFSEPFSAAVGRNGEIRNLGLVNVNIIGSGRDIGGLVGYNYEEGTVTKCYCTGMVSGGDSVGGLVGDNSGDVVFCYSSARVHGQREVGGLVGYNREWGDVQYSYARGNVSGRIDVGGLIGDNYCTVELEGGLATVCQCYSTGAVDYETGRAGGLIGCAGGVSIVTSCFWDIVTSGQSTMCGAQDGDATGCDHTLGLPTAEMQTKSTFTDVGWDFIDETENGTDDIWWILEGQDYPRLWWEEPGPADFGEWIELSSMKTARDQFAGAVIGDEIFVFGGNGPDESDLYTGERYDTGKDAWFNIADRPHGFGWGVEEVSGIALNGRFYVFGGRGRYNQDGDYGVLNYNEMYDPATNTWTTLATKPTATRAAVPVVYGDKIYSFGGLGEEDYYTTVECYDPDRDTWRHVTDMPKAILNMAIAVHHGSAYLIGGYDRKAGVMNDEVLVYDFQADTWIRDHCTVPPHAVRVYPYATQAPIVNGRIYLIGGIEVESRENAWTCARFTVFDIAARRWQSGPALPEPRRNHLAVIVDNTIYVIGGDDGLDTQKDTVFSLRLPD